MNERMTLRTLPFAARLVLSCFLCAVGIGYFSAMVQLHMQHSSREGNHLPTPEDVLERFSGLKKYNPNDVPVSKIEMLISGPAESGWGKGNMAPAFFTKSGNAYTKDCTERGKAVVDAEREGERLLMKVWCQLAADAKKKAYEDDAMPYPSATADFKITEEFFDKEKKVFPIKSVIEKRCLKCHNGDQKPDMDDFAKLEPLVTPPSQEILPGGFVRSSKQISGEGLTQSTHAHLLSFAVLFTLTGLIFAFSSYPGWLRCVLGPIVLVAQVADVSCWWLARIPNQGYLFAQAIMFTGGIVGVGLAAQIILSLFNMFGRLGKVVLLAVFIAASAGFGTLYTNVISPELAKEKLETSTRK